MYIEEKVNTKKAIKAAYSEPGELYKKGSLFLMRVHPIEENPPYARSFAFVNVANGLQDLLSSEELIEPLKAEVHVYNEEI